MAPGPVSSLWGVEKWVEAYREVKGKLWGQAKFKSRLKSHNLSASVSFSIKWA